MRITKKMMQDSFSQKSVTKTFRTTASHNHPNPTNFLLIFLHNFQQCMLCYAGQSLKSFKILSFLSISISSHFIVFG